ncbi:hypothetical protein [Thalassospira lucentensis]|uniref:hypothetical protein n=1 Tax=Thalassospira lucentensis TaxID=168935 RepID=UPI0020CA7092|nr:hypothetical protein [Thalassospira lucentensis]
MADEESENKTPPNNPASAGNTGDGDAGNSDASGAASAGGASGSTEPKSADGGSDAAKDGGDADGDDGGSKPAADNSPPLSTALNPQIVQAVGTTNHAVLNGAIPGANGVAYQKVAQASAYAVQDSTDYLRSIMSMASATTGVAMQKMLATKEVEPYSDIIAAAAKAVADAQDTFTKVGTAASSVVKDFDSMA